MLRICLLPVCNASAFDAPACNASAFNAPAFDAAADGGRLLRHVSPERRERISRLRLPAAKRDSLFGALLVRMAAGRFTGRPPGELEFGASGAGKPYLIGGGCFFSLSHTPGLIVCAVSDGETGADAERVRTPPARVSSRFAEAERLWIGNSGERFFRVWTRKEAYGKYLGCGISGTLGTDTLDPEISRLLHTFRFGGHVCSACAADLSDISAELVSYDDILEFYGEKT